MKREPVIYVGHMTRKERKNFKKDHPGQRLAFRQRYPHFPIYREVERNEWKSES